MQSSFFHLAKKISKIEPPDLWGVRTADDDQDDLDDFVVSERKWLRTLGHAMQSRQLRVR